MSEEDFIKVWSESSRESILHQFYWERKELREIIDKAIEYLNNLPTGELEENVYNLSVILNGEDKE